MLLLIGCGAPLARADEPPIEELVISGEQPGPGLWQVRYGDHTLWLLGTVTPMPAGLQWRSKEVEQRIAASQVYLENVDVRFDLSTLRIVSLVPSLLRARKLPKGETLATVLEPAQYARWHALQQRYAPQETLDGLRPLLATYPIYRKALTTAGLVADDRIPRTTLRLANQAKVPVRTPRLQMNVEDPKDLVREYAASAPGLESGCLDNLLTRMERDLPLLQRAEAWAKGDVATLRSLAGETTRDRCLDFLAPLPRIARKVEEARQRVEQEWLLAADGALLRNHTSFGVLGIDQLFRADGLLARLKERGYEVIEPQ